jgi:hypothetical protein
MLWPVHIHTSRVHLSDFISSWLFQYVLL